MVSTVAPAATAPAPAALNRMPDIVVLVAHPQLRQSRVNAALMAAAARADASRVEVCDLYAHYPDYYIDVPREQARIAQARLIVWQHPVHWYGMPPLMKLWLDEVFAFGWAYGPGGMALQGKDLWPVLTTGGTAESYQPDGHNRRPFEDFLPPLEQTAILTGMRILPPWIIHGAHRLDEAEIRQQADTYLERLQHYPAWPGGRHAATSTKPNVPDDARPASR